MRLVHSRHILKEPLDDVKHMETVINSIKFIKARFRRR
ncbi:hypothetical protein D1AOALGA4SA_9822 [Olavius algarvensis Delta 1 endosymbiont]|nr:hypothetical protein D1AOALGA4SA_9822 [Olavius algarvensis Delta 1 endosymbiont]